MSPRFDYALRVVLGEEGGYSNHPADRGGATMRGVTQDTFSAYLDSIGSPNRRVSEITDDEVEAIYFAYWKDAKCDRIPEPLDVAVFDCAINSGAGRAIKLLQRTLGIDEDGVFGKATMTALHEDAVALGLGHLCAIYLKVRRDWYYEIVERRPTQRVFLEGWLNRIDHLKETLA